uniref:Secreted protein n=1 Tax=Cannabis sativa TaxID=3483 RepID=A0A803RB66_CANSA
MPPLSRYFFSPLALIVLSLSQTDLRFVCHRYPKPSRLVPSVVDTTEPYNLRPPKKPSPCRPHCSLSLSLSLSLSGVDPYIDDGSNSSRVHHHSSGG